MCKIPKGYQQVLTKDNSTTLKSVDFDENFHSLTGARTETITHYIKGCKILENANKNSNMNILEVGFGTGTGLIETYQELKDSKADIFYCSLELNSDLVEYFLQNENVDYIKENQFIKFKYKNIKVLVIVGDARLQFRTFNHPKYHAIYQDAFSPQKNTTLWTMQWFTELKNVADNNCILSTYSASSGVRLSLIDAGWFVFKGENFGVRAESTRAKLSGPSDEEIISRLNRSHMEVITDQNSDKYFDMMKKKMKKKE